MNQNITKRAISVWDYGCSVLIIYTYTYKHTLMLKKTDITRSPILITFLVWDCLSAIVRGKVKIDKVILTEFQGPMTKNGCVTFP